MKANVKGIATIISLLLVALGLTPFFSITQATIYTYKDASTFSTNPDTKYGTLNIAYVGAVPSANEYHYLFMTFDLSPLPAGSQITDIKLNTYCQYIRTGAAGFYEVTYALSNIWEELSITWNNQPQLATGAADSKYIDVVGWRQWALGEYSTYANEHIQTDKKVTFVLVPDRDVPAQETMTVWRTREYGGGFCPYIVVTYGAPSYKLTVLVKDAVGNAVQGADITSPFVATTDIYGKALAEIASGGYTVKAEYQGIAYTQAVNLDMDRTVTITVPIYTLTVIVTDTVGNPISGVAVLKPVSGSTDTRGIFTTNLRAGTYTVVVSKDGIQASETVTLTSGKTVSLYLGLYSVRFKVVDQCGNPLSAKVTLDTKSEACDKSGYSPIFSVPYGTYTVSTEVKVKEKTFNATETISVTADTTKTITITRRFLWSFHINYADSTLATGTITATSTKETLKIPITSGYGEGYLIDATYTFIFKASPEVTLGAITVKNDGDFSATINVDTNLVTQTSSTETPTTSPTSPVTTPAEISWLLIPSIYIYTLLGVLVFGFIIAAIVRLRRPPK